jgi:hypothetical protein
MSRDSIARLSFGVAFKEDFEFPWSDKEKYPDGIEDWWLEITEYIQPLELYNFDSILDDEITWLKLHPVPIKVVRTCTYDYSGYILAVKTMWVDWAETLKVDPEQLISNINEDTKVITDFLDKYNIKCEDSPGWILSSFYG